MLIEEARRLVPLLREEAKAIEDGRRLTPRVHNALVEAGVYRMTMPPQVGAPEVTLPEAMRVLETLSMGDASTAWSVWAALGAPAMSAFLSEEGVQELFSARDAVVVGSVAAMGRAEAVGGGYRVTGRWPFASGIHQATHAGGMCFVFDGDTQRLGPNGEPAVMFPLWPVADCAIIDTWDTTGLRGTGSDDIEVSDLFVPEHLVVDFSRAPRQGLAPVHYVHVDNAANITVAAIGIGIARAALAAFRRLAPEKKLPNGTPLAESDLGKLILARTESGLAQARGQLYETAEIMSDEMAEGRFPGEEWFARTSLASVTAVDAAIDTVTQVYRAAGSNAVRRSNIFDRCLRDIFTLGAHKTVQHVNLVLYGGAAFAAADGVEEPL
jgi:alkylation response protein AidB-like acyl-CoA dehydrogenase